MENEHARFGVNSFEATTKDDHAEQLSGVGCLPDVASLLEAFKAFVEQAYSVFGCFTVGTGSFHTGHLLDIKFHVNRVQRECFGDVALVELQFEGYGYAQEETQ